MLTFKYTARDPKTHEEIKATVQAQSQPAAVKLITDQGLTPTDIEVQTSGSKFSSSNKISSKDKIVFFRQLSTLVGAGLPLTQSLRTVIDQVDSKGLVTVLMQVVSDVEGGTPLADTMAKHPKVFNDVVVSLIAAGEASGMLDESLKRIADQTEKDAEMVSKVRGALVYPAIVLFVIIAVIVFMLTTVLPQIELLYQDLNQDLPLTTDIMLRIASALTSFWWVLLILLGAGGFLLKKYIETDSGRRQFDYFKMKVPLFGKLFKKLYMARFARTGAILMQSGVQMLEMLRITSRAVNNVLVADDIIKAAGKVRGGKQLSESLSDSDHFLSLVPQMISIGEKSGSIDGMMSKAADFYEKELDDEIKTISTIIEPLLMVVLAVVAAIMVGAILLPVYGLVGGNISI
ncbi:MAG: type II secretion system F family protein [Candidatus Saccharimonadales bacterium]